MRYIMNILTAFEELSLIPFCSDEIIEKFTHNLPDINSRTMFLNGDQLNLRRNLAANKDSKFADAIDVVKF